MDPEFDQNIDKLLRDYQNPSSKLFLETSDRRIYNQAKRDAASNPISHETILRFKRSIEQISRLREQRILRNKPRYLSRRSWRVYGSNCILLADLFFLKPIREHNSKHYVCICLMDGFSKMVYVSQLKNASSSEVERHLKISWNHFGGKFLKFCSDKGDRSPYMFVHIQSYTYKHVHVLS